MVFDLYNLLCALLETRLYIIWNGEQEMDFQPWLQHCLGANLIDVWFSSISELSVGERSALPIRDPMMILKRTIAGTGRLARRNWLLWLFAGVLPWGQQLHCKWENKQQGMVA